MEWVYVLKSEKTEKLYIGLTNNLRIRLKQHRDNKVPSTKNGGPWRVVYVEGYSSRKDAATREHNLKYFGNAYRQLKRRLKNSLGGS